VQPTIIIIMQTLPILAFTAALAAFLPLPVDFGVAVSILVAAGLAAIVFSDYSRRANPLPSRAPAAAVAARREERLRLTA